MTDDWPCLNDYNLHSHKIKSIPLYLFTPIPQGFLSDFNK